MPAFTPKDYQRATLKSVEFYFRECQRMGNADYAFQEATKALWGRKSDFTPLAGFPEEMPYFCVRVPTGGGILPANRLRKVFPRFRLQTARRAHPRR